MSQDEYIKKIQELFKQTKPMLATNYYRKGDEWGWGRWLPLSQAPRPIDHRTVLSNEIVIDIDAKAWETNKNFGNLVKLFLEEKKIPYIMCQTGGKGIHQHIWFESTVSNEFMPTLLRAKKQGFNYRQLRIALWKYILIAAGVKLNYMGKGEIFDDANINFDDDTKGHMIRIIGGRKLIKTDELGNTEWGFKTLITKIPDKKKKLTMPSEVTYPDKLEIWNVPEGITKGIITEFLARIDSSKEERRIQKYEGLYTRLPCVQKLISSGNEEGARHAGAGAVALACAMDNLQNTNTMDILKEYKRACDALGGVTSFSIKELKSWVDWYKSRADELYWNEKTCAITKGFKNLQDISCADCPLMKQINKEAIAFLSKGYVVEKIQEELGHEIVSEKESRMILFLCYCSAYLTHRIHPKLSGVSATGKSYLLNVVLGFIPPEDILEKLTGVSAKYFNYALTENPNIPKIERDGIMIPNINGKILVVQEFEGAQDAIITLRPLMSGDQEGLSVGIVDKNKEGQIVHKKMQAFGTPVFATASTSFQLDNEYMTRCWELEMDDSGEQTKDIMMFEAEEDVVPKCHISPFKEVIKDSIRLLKQSIRQVINPFSLLLAERMPVSREFVRLRRDFKKAKEFIKIVAWLNQFQRSKINIDGEDFVLATLEDYNIVRDLIQSSFKMIFAGSSKAREVYSVCEEYAKKGEDITTAVVAREIGKGTSLARALLNLLDSKGFLLKKRPERGREFIYEVRQKTDVEFPNLTLSDLKNHYEELKGKNPKVAEILFKILDEPVESTEDNKEVN